MTKQIIESWAFLEMMNPGEIPSLEKKINKKLVKGGGSYQQVVPISKSAPLFEELVLHNPVKNKKHFTYFLSAYTNAELVDLLRSHFNNEDEVINKSHDLYYSFTFDVNEKRDYIEDSLSIPHMQLIIDDIKRTGQISYDDFTDRYEKKKIRFEEEFRVIMQNGVGDVELKEAEGLFEKYFSSVTSDSSRSYVQCLILNKTTPTNLTHFNSFYLNDLQAILRQGENETLRQFIEGTEMKVDVDENREAIEEILSVKNLPIGRWPSPVNHRLSLMQQVAVNHIVNENEPISSVNGPPGTGKTTLLKDIFAQLVVERTMNMVTYDDPTKAFSQVGKQDIEMGPKTYSYNMYQLDPEIAKYSMVVASSNNGAVENISKELPLLGEIVRADKPSQKERDKAEERGNVDPIRFYEYDQTYAEEAEKLNYFSKYAEELLEEESAWGMFSGAFGKSSNIQNMSKSLRTKQDGLSFLDSLVEDTDGISWEDAVEEFNALRDEIERDKKELQAYIDDMDQFEQLSKELEGIPNLIAETREQEVNATERLQQLEKENGLLKERLDNLPKPNFFVRVIRSMTGSMDEVEAGIRKERDTVLKNLSAQSKEQDTFEETIHRLEKRKVVLQNEVAILRQKQDHYKDSDVTLSTDEFWSATSYAKRQTGVLWQTHELNFKRGLLFLKALQVHKVFLRKNHKHLKVSITMLQNLRSINLNIGENKENVGHMWKVLHLIFPIMSTTFASLGTMYRGIGADFIDYLFVDEAGQASPQQAAGGLWRTKRAIVVGDPIQIEPVVTLDETILSDIRKAFNVSEHYIGPTASVQTMADYANPIGTIKGEGDNRHRIGIPLWVHRRCIEPMFSISNEIAYDNKMVLAMDEVGESEWFDVQGQTEIAQYVGDHGEFIVEEIEQHFEGLKEGEMPSVFIITPFTAVKDQLITLINRRLGSKIEGLWKWTRNSIGTVHTFQGKEAKVVYFVTGTDQGTDGAANWSCSKPNLLNVAVTRAKKEFYVVGDLERFKTKRYYQTIVNKMEEFKK